MTATRISHRCGHNITALAAIGKGGYPAGAVPSPSSAAPRGPEPLIVVGPTPPPTHGVSVMTLTMLEALRSAGLLAGHVDTKDPRTVDIIGRFDLENVRLGIVHSLRFVRLLARTPGTAVYIGLSQGTWGFVRDAVLLLTARAFRRRRYVQVHGGNFDAFYSGAAAPLRAVVRASLAGAHAAWVLTPRLRPMFDGLVPEDRVEVLPNAVVDPFTAGAPVRSRDADEPVRVLYLGNLLPEKGCFDLLAALEELGPDGAKLAVRFAGQASADVEEEVLARAEALRHRGGPQVEYAGSADEAGKRKHYAWADVFVFPSRNEGQPLVLLEALAAGLPIVTTSYRGIPDTVRDGVEGVLVAPAAPEELATALRRVMADPELRQRLGSAARARYEAAYRPERFRENLIGLLASG